MRTKNRIAAYNELVQSPTRGFSVFVVNLYLRTLIFGLVSAGMLIPAWAVQPCDCHKSHGDCCSESAKPLACCHPKSNVGEKTCCSREALPTSEEANSCEVGCPCCTDSPEPTIAVTPSVRQIDHDQPVFALVRTPAVGPALTLASFPFVENGSPSGHLSLRLHALYRVWQI